MAAGLREATYPLTFAHQHPQYFYLFAGFKFGDQTRVFVSVYF
jgi:hypothetical protein